AFGKLLTVRWEICATATGRHQQVDRPTRNGWRFFWQKLQKLLWVPGFFRSKEASQCWLRCEIKVWRESMARSGQKNSAPLCAESNSGSARSEVIKLIRHRLHEPLGPTLLVLQLLLREESLSPQGVALIRMLQRSIKQEGCEVVVGMVHDKAAIHSAKEGELRPENAEAKRRRLALFDGLVEKRPANLLIDEMRGYEHPEEYFVFFDRNHLFQFSDQIA